MKFLAVHPGCAIYTKIYLRLEPLGLEMVSRRASSGTRCPSDRFAGGYVERLRGTDQNLEARRRGVRL